MNRFAILSLFIGVCFGDSVSRSIREISAGNLDRRDFAVDLNATTFDSVLRETPANFAVVEFFAHWCPACRNYKPQYEKVARLFNGPDAVHPGLILMTRVDCADKINTKLCDRFSVDHFPMLFWGPPSKFVGGNWDKKKDKIEITLISTEDMRTSDKLLNWINQKMGSTYGLKDDKFENEQPPTNISDPKQIARAIYDVEEATAKALDIIVEHKMIKSNTRASLIRFLQILVAHHPSKRCRKGSAEILVNSDDLFPSDVFGDKQENNNGNVSLGSFQICGKDVPHGYWMFCRGSRKDTRGFSCGLWVLIHSLSVRLDDAESHFAFTSICDFVNNFFVCEECRRHFSEMCSSVSNPFNTSRDLTLWLWDAHNKVNTRLIKEELTLETVDPSFPKMIWPPKQLCPSCYRSEDQKEDNEPDWNRDEVYEFLTSYYGKTLVSLHKDKEGIQGNETIGDGSVEEIPPGSFVVPIGAAFAIAIASCAFGALAYYWRSRQKTRKPRRNWS